jgi:hypothetical protein
VHPSFLPHTRQMSCPYHPSRFNHPHKKIHLALHIWYKMIVHVWVLVHSNGEPTMCVYMLTQRNNIQLFAAWSTVRPPSVTGCKLQYQQYLIYQIHEALRQKFTTFF